MPRKTRLALVGERLVEPDLNAAASAERALEDATAAAHPLVPPSDVVAMLHRQVAETARVANQAFEDANQQRERAASLEAELSQTKAANARISSEAEIARKEVQTVVASIQRRDQAAEAASSAQRIAIAQATARRLGEAMAFIVDRVPILLTLAGAFVLARSMLPQPDIYQLAELAIYGAVAVAPAAWLNLRRG